ncbi:acyloxyacyl hydrolase [Pontibacter toksunensis]|uniref:Acyloxyacyl hydrolase n=1 Tax=Pontibacter toksunensis TaxID=1332631 RepID=A0ABW6BZU2_9BACT
MLAQKAHSHNKEPWSFGVNGYYGTLFRYRSGLPALNFTHPFGTELYANRHTFGRREWERVFKYPQIGFALSYYNYGVPDELGEAVSLTTYLDNVIIEGPKSSLRFNVGTGLVYSSRYYTPITNEMNKAIGSPITFSFRGTLRYEFPLSTHTFLNLNLAFRHFSNGGLNKPNNGMNFPLLGVGLRYQAKQVQHHVASDSAAPVNRSWRFNLRFAAGVKEVLRIDEKHPVYNVTAYASKRMTKASSVLVGADAFHDSALHNEFINISQTPPDEELDPRMAGITVGHELHLGKLSFITQLGRYVYRPYTLFPTYYQRYGLQYCVTKNLSASAMLMVHSRTANVVEWGIGLHL